MTESYTFIFQLNRNSSPLAVQSAHRVEKQKRPFSTPHVSKDISPLLAIKKREEKAVFEG